MKITLLKVFSPWLLLIVMSSEGLALKLGKPPQENQSLAFADSALACGIYYQYTAGGLEKNPRIDRATVRAIKQNSAALLHTATLLYQAAGISSADKREEFMQKASDILQEKGSNTKGINALIYKFGEKCRHVLTTYSDKIRPITTQPGSI